MLLVPQPISSRPSFLRSKFPINFGVCCLFADRSQDVGETADVHDPSPHFQCNEHGRETEDVDHPPSRCREAHEYVFKPLSGKIASSSLVFSVGFLVAATAIDDAKGVTLVNVCFGLAGLCFLFAVVAALVFGMDKIAEGRKRSQERAERADEHAVPFSP